MALTRPPITTVASGRWTSAPVEVANAIGRNPKLATQVAISTGRRRLDAPLSTASRRPVLVRSWLTELMSTTPLSILAAIRGRFEQWGLVLHPTKTRIVYCKDDNRPGEYEHVAFDFLGYTFRPRQARNRRGKNFNAFLPAMSSKAATRVRRTLRAWRLASTKKHFAFGGPAPTRGPGGARVDELLRPVLPDGVRAHTPTSQRGPAAWVRRKYKTRFRYRKRASRHWLRRVAHRDPRLFALWQLGVKP